MSTVGIIANPASGRDIRRLVTHASVFDNLEKAHILRRIFLALDALGVKRIVYMPDYDGLVEKAINGVKLDLEVEEIRMNVWGDERDTTEAARYFSLNNVNCIVTLGGDGTNRSVAKGSHNIPLIPISTGTNNVFPNMIEGTVAGLAAGLLAKKMVDSNRVTYTSKRLEVQIDGQLEEIALIDVAVCSELFIGSKALWNRDHIKEIILTRAEPDSIGMSAIGGFLHPIGPRDEQGIYVRLGGGNGSVLVPVAPGLVSKVDWQEYRLLSFQDEVCLDPKDCTIALDGERQIEVRGDQTVTIKLTNNGPVVVDIRCCLHEASRLGVLSF
ncbi:MAG: ATP-NAD kinase family protein [Desulfomonilaceae bacterium]